MTMTFSTEHETFARLIDALETVQSAAQTLAILRPEQSRGWTKIAENFGIMKEACYQLVERGVQ